MPVFAVLALAPDILIIIYCSVKALVTQKDRKTHKKDGVGIPRIQRSEKKEPTFHLPVWITTEAKLWNRAGKTNTVPFREQQCLFVQIKTKGTRTELCRNVVVTMTPSPFSLSLVFNGSLNRL